MHAPLRQQLEGISDQPGVYLFKNSAGALLYIGKASHLRSRVRSYFQASNRDQRYFIHALQHEVATIETIVVTNEKEAALLENTLIKQHKPKYNIKLRDDKEYLSLRLDPNADWPRLEAVRRPKDDGAWYFGPYPSASTARRVLRLINRHFKLRTCTDRELRSRKRPCLQYQIKRCPAPCVLPVDSEEYAAQINSVMLFLSGKHNALMKMLQQRMRAASAEHAYELAASYRDQAQAIAAAVENQTVVTQNPIDQNVIHFAREQSTVNFSVLILREGKLSDVQHFTLRDVIIPDEEMLAAFVSEYFQNAAYIPDEVVLPMRFDLLGGFEKVLSERAHRRITIVIPQRGDRVKLLDMARENASNALAEHTKKQADRDAMLGQLANLLHLDKAPERMECIDVSHTAGQDTVASVVVMINGELAPHHYRSFYMKRATAGDDYGAMHEALSRRIRHATMGDDGWELPDLLVVDGGKGQLGVAMTVLSDLQVDDLPVAALAKPRINRMGEIVGERIFVAGRKNPISVSAHRETLFLTMLRDEAHRTANRMRMKQSDRRVFVHRLDQIPGVGKKTRVLLLKNLGSLDRVKSASVDELLRSGANRTQAVRIYECFHGAQHFETDSAEVIAVDNAFEA